MDTAGGDVVKVGGVGPELTVEQKSVVLACAISIDLDKSQSELSKSEDARCALAADLERSEAARIAAENADRRADRDGAGRGTDDRRDDRDGRDGDRRDDRDGAGRGRGDVGNDGRRDDRGSDQRNEYGTSGRRLVSSLENRPGVHDADTMLMHMMLEMSIRQTFRSTGVPDNHN